MQQDGRKRRGRFIKQGSSILDKISLNEFSFDDISNLPTILPDNTRKSVIHAPYHEPSELSEAVRPFKNIQQDLIPQHQRRPVMTPLDFSKDWERARRMRRNKDETQDEEEFDYENAMAHAKAVRDSAKKSNLSQSTSSKTSSEEDSISPNQHMGIDAHNTQNPLHILRKNEGIEGDSELAENTPQFPSQVENKGLNWGSMDIAGKAINDLGHKTQTEFSSPLKVAVDTFKKKSDMTEEFIPQSGQSDQIHGLHDPELAAAEEYKNRVHDKQIDQEELKNLIEEEKAHGYRDGYRLGEEKAEIQVRAASKEMFEKVESLIQDFGNLQKSMMENVQENFFIVCQALAESLLKREFTIHPEAFNAVMERAITEAIEPGKVKVRVHPDTYDRLVSIGKNQLIDTLIKDPDVAQGDFKLESQMSVVDVNIGKLVAQLLSQADLNLFDALEQAG